MTDIDRIAQLEQQVASLLAQKQPGREPAVVRLEMSAGFLGSTSATRRIENRTTD